MSAKGKFTPLGGKDLQKSREGMQKSERKDLEGLPSLETRKGLLDPSKKGDHEVVVQGGFSKKS